MTFFRSAPRRLDALLVSAIAAGAALFAGAGPALAQGDFEVDEVAAERAIERALVQTGSILLPSGAFEIAPFVTYQREETTFGGPLVVQDDQFVTSDIAIDRDQAQAGVILRAGLPWSGQIDLTVPYVYSQRTNDQTVGGAAFDTASDDLDGIGDIQLTYTQSLRPAGSGFPNVLASVTYDSDTGRSNDEILLGSGFEEVRVALTVTQRQDPLVLSGRISYEHGFENNDIEPGDTWGLDFGTFLAVNPETSLQFGVSFSYTEDAAFNGENIDGSDQFAASLSVGLATILDRGTLLDTSVSVGLTDDAPDVALAISLPIRFGS